MIKTLSGIRFYLFLIIFIRHFDYINQTHFLFPSFKTLHFVFFAVTFFFILSGFCIALGYSEKFQELKKETILEFYKKRFIKIYPLYLLTGLVFLFFHFKDIDTKWAKHFLLEYIPMISADCGNGAAWFIQALFLAYLISPFWNLLMNKLAKLNNKTAKTPTLIISIGILYLISIFFATIFSSKYPTQVYSSHFMRLLQFLLGYSLGLSYKYLNIKKYIDSLIEKNKNIYLTNLSDIIFVLILFVSIYFVGGVSWHSTIILDYILYVPLVCIGILYLSISKTSILNKFLESKISLFLANISFEAYLIHYIFIQFTSKFTLINTKAEIIIAFCLLLFATIATSIGYKKLQNFIEHKTMVQGK